MYMLYKKLGSCSAFLPTVLEARDDGANKATLNKSMDIQGRHCRVFGYGAFRGKIAYLDAIRLDSNEAMELLACSPPIFAGCELYLRLLVGRHYVVVCGWVKGKLVDQFEGSTSSIARRLVSCDFVGEIVVDSFFWTL